MSENKKWFQQEVEPPKEKIITSKIKGAYLERCLNLKNPIKKRRDMNNLYVGAIGDMYKPEVMYDTILKFWDAGTEEVTYSSEFYLEGGSISGERIARRLHDGGLTYCKFDEHEEHVVFNEQFGWKGRVDAILDNNLIMYHGKKTRPLEKPTETDFRCWEVKETGSNNYANWVSFTHLPTKYRTQLTIYLHELLKDSIIESNEGHFLILNRDNPKAFRVLDYKMEHHLLDEAKRSANTFWEHIRNRTTVEGFKPLTSKFIDEAIESGYNTGRQWPELSGIK